MNLLQPMMVVTLLVTGMGVALLGSLKVPLARRLAIDEARIGGLVSLFGFVLIPVILIAGFWTDQAGHEAGSQGKELVLLAGSVLFAVSLVILAAARTYGMALTAVILLSASWAVMINVGNVLTPAAFGGEPVFAFNLANVFFGLGAFLTPLAIALLVPRTSLPRTVAVLAGVSLMPALLALGADLSEIGGADPGPYPDLTTVLAEPLLWLCGLGMFFYGPLEASMAAWTTTYLGDQGYAEATAARGLSAFWLAFMATRFVTALTLPLGQERLLILMLAMACVAVLAGMVVSRTRRLSLAFVVAAGLVLGPIFPTLLAVLLAPFPAQAQGRAVGFFFALGGIGWSLIPMAMGAYARTRGVQRGFAVAAVAAACLSGVALLLLQW
jgi:fucose permease